LVAAAFMPPALVPDIVETPFCPPDYTNKTHLLEAML
jgi:hypothetical protein